VLREEPTRFNGGNTKILFVYRDDRLVRRIIKPFFDNKEAGFQLFDILANLASVQEATYMYSLAPEQL